MQALSRHSETSYLPFGLRRGVPDDLPSFPLNLNWAKSEPRGAARPRTYPSPSMSGSPPLPLICNQGAGDRTQVPSYQATASPDSHHYQHQHHRRIPSSHGDFAPPHQHGTFQSPSPYPQPQPPPAQSHMSPYQQDSMDRSQYAFQRPSQSPHHPAPFQPVQPPTSLIPPPHPYHLHHSSVDLGPASALPSIGQSTLSGSPSPYLSQSRPPTQDAQPYTSPKMQRKTKGHVASACVPCKKAHLRCDAQRPCSRCISNGKEDMCVDVQHKKRGRPRLRDDREARYDMSGRPGGGGPSHESGARRPLSLYSQPSHVGHGGSYEDPIRRSQSYRVLKSQPNEGPMARYIDRTSTADANIFPTPLSIAPRHQEPIAFLTTDFEIAKASTGFLDATGRHSVKGMKLLDVVALTERERILSLQSQLQDDQRRREPSYLPPMFARQEEERILQGLGFGADEVARYSLDRQAFLTFSAHDGQPRTYSARVGLVKIESIYFVILQLLINSRAHGQLTPSPHGRDSRDSPFQYQAPASSHYAPQPSQPTPVSATFNSERPRLGSDAGVYGVRSQGSGSQMMPGHNSPGISSSTYAASPSRTDYPAATPSYQIPRSELTPSTRPPYSQPPPFQLPPIRNEHPPSAAPAPPPEPSSWPRDDRLKVGGIIDNPAPLDQQPKPR